MGSNCSSNKLSAVNKTVEVPGLKIAVIGDSEVGKSCVLDRYINNLFSPLYIPTRKVALRNVVRKLNIPGHATVPITFWDIPGEEDLDIHESYFRNLDAVIVVVDGTSSSSIETAKLWRLCVLSNANFTTETETEEQEQKLQNLPSTQEPGQEGYNSSRTKSVDDLPFLLLGNKKDLIPSDKIEDVEIINTENQEANEEDTKVADRLTEIVNKMEEVSSTDFVGSVLVSAKSNDLSIHNAIQSFLRRVLEDRYVERRWRAVEKTPKVKRQRYGFVSQLERVDITEIDREFTKADEVLHRVKSLRLYQDDSLVKFASQCVQIGIIDSTKNASMQNCLVGVRNKLEALDLKLKLVLLEDLFTLEVKATEADAELQPDIRYAIKTFNKEYVAVTMAMLKEFPLAEERLEKIDQNISRLCLQFKVAPPPGQGQTMTSEELHSKAASIERNRARMKHTSHTCQESLTSIQALVKQVKTAFVW